MKVLSAKAYTENLKRQLYKVHLQILKKSKYTLQDVDKFTRYYLDDYPVRTYIVGEDRLLIVGKLNADIWKYTLEYDANNVLTFLEMTPVLFIFNIILFIFVSIRMYKARQRRIEEERVEWIAGVSHDIRTPLAVILGNTQMIPKESDMDEIKRKAEIIERTVFPYPTRPTEKLLH